MTGLNVFKEYFQNLGIDSGSLCRMEVTRTEPGVPVRHSFIASKNRRQ